MTIPRFRIQNGMKTLLAFLLVLCSLGLQAQTTISKVTGGTILVDKGSRAYNLLSSYRLQKFKGNVQVLHDKGGVIDNFNPANVDTLIHADGTIITSFDLDTLFTELLTHFFNSEALTGDFFTDVSKGLIPGHTAVVISSSVMIPVKDVVNDVWEEGGTLVYLSAAETMNIVSDDAGDALAGTGARTLRVTGLGAGNDILIEVVNMNGLTNVLTVNSYLYPPILTVVTAGGDPSKTNLGNITATASVSGDVQSKIAAGIGISKNSHFTVPNGKSLVIVKADVNATKTAAGTLPNIIITGLSRLAGQDPDAAWISRTVREMDTSVLDQLFVDQPVNNILPEGTEFRGTAVSSENNTNVRIRFYAILIDNQ